MRIGSLFAIFAWLSFAVGNPTRCDAQPSAKAAATATVVTVDEIEGDVRVLRAGAAVADKGYLGQVLMPGDRLKTGANSRAVVRLAEGSRIRLGSGSHLELIAEPSPQPVMKLWRGILYLFHRERPGRYEMRTPSATAIVLGTEFNLKVVENGTSTLNVIDGEVQLANEFGELRIVSGEGGVVETGKAPVRTAVIETVNVIQWSLYYPGILDLAELGANAADSQTLAESFAAYRAGDLLAAATRYPVSRQPDSAREKIYLASVLLSVGQIERAEELIKAVAPAPNEGAPRTPR